MLPSLKPANFFDLSYEKHRNLFDDVAFVWEVLPRLQNYLNDLLNKQGRQILGNVSPGAFLSGDDIYIERGAFVEAGAYIAGPAYISANAQVRHGAYIRSNVLIGEGAIVGHATEIKNSVLLANAHAPHFNYVGDSVLGRNVNLGAGTKLSNLTVVSTKDAKTGKRPTIKLKIGDHWFDTGLAKLGAILGDDVQTGCNSVLNPGVLIGPRTLIYANASLPKGYYPSDSILKLRQTFEHAKRR